jgi:hypothetical protein
MDSLFVGFSGGDFACTENEPVLTPEGLYAGFLLGAGICGESKAYAIFEVGADKQVTFRRFCTRPEKKVLAKIVYYFRAVRKVRTPLNDGNECKLFFTH